MENEEKREYKITKSDLGYKVYRQKWDEDNRIVEWLQKETYTYNKEYARTFYTLNDAMGALVVARVQKWKIEDNSEREEKAEIQSWSDL